LKLSLEKFLFLLGKQLDPNADKKFKENLNIFDYSIEKETNKPKFALAKILSGDLAEEEANSITLAFENGFNFNSNYLIYSPIFERQGFNYSDFLDYLLNFCDEKYNIDIPTLINIVTTGLKVYEIGLFYANISDKNYKNYTGKKQQIFFGKIDTVFRKGTTKRMPESKKTRRMSVFEIKTIKTLKSVKEREKEEKAYKEINSQNGISNAVDLTESKNFYENNLKYLNNQASESNIMNFNVVNKNVISNNFGENLQSKKTGFKQELKNVFSVLSLGRGKSGEKNYLQKIEKTKNVFELPDKLSIPLITRACVVSFYNDLKEFQNDLSKKISENILKNQKYLEEIIKDKKSGNSETKLQNKKKAVNKGLIGGFNKKSKEKKADSAVNDFAKSIIEKNKDTFQKENKSKIFNNSIDPSKIENLDRSEVDNFDIRITSLEEKMEKLLFMTERIFNVIEKRENSINSRDESVNASFEKADEDTNRSATTMKIEKYYGQVNLEEFET